MTILSFPGFVGVQKRLEEDIHKLCTLPKHLFSVSLPETRDKPSFDLEILTGLGNMIRYYFLLPKTVCDQLHLQDKQI